MRERAKTEDDSINKERERAASEVQDSKRNEKKKKGEKKRDPLFQP